MIRPSHKRLQNTYVWAWFLLLAKNKTWILNDTLVFFPFLEATSDMKKLRFRLRGPAFSLKNWLFFIDLILKKILILIERSTIFFERRKSFFEQPNFSKKLNFLFSLRHPTSFRKACPTMTKSRWLENNRFAVTCHQKLIEYKSELSGKLFFRVQVSKISAFRLQKRSWNIVPEFRN